MADETHDEQQDQIAHEPEDVEAPDGRPNGGTGASDDIGLAAGDDFPDETETTDDEPGDPRAPADDDEDAADGEPADHDTGPVGNPARFERGAQPDRRIANDLNAEIIGTLHVWYTGHTGEVVIPMDADAALRCIAGWHQNRPSRWQDHLDPVTSDGRAAWAAVELRGVLAMLWLPGLPPARQPQRMAVDPVAM